MITNASKILLLLFLLNISLLGCSHTPTSQLGVHSNLTFAPCPSSPNCVSSFADGDAFISPIQFPPSCKPLVFLASMFGIQKHISIVKQTNDYMRVEFKSNLFGFIDDVEFMVAGSELRVRSASRTGYSDFGVNRSRMENIRSKVQSECK